MKPENVVDVLFGNRLRQLLDERNISQAHFADRIGVSRSRMNNYVAQRSEPDYATLIRIANTLDTSIDFLLGKSEHQGLPQTACLSGFPDFIPSRGAGGEPPDPSCWIPLYGSQYEAPEPDAAPAAPSDQAARTGKRPARPIRSDGFATRRRQAVPRHMKIGRLPRQSSSNRVNGALVADTERLHARSACCFRDAEA
ncbi:MAG: helix-turn-helix domain-containing protein [Bilophila wadsworthia]